MMQGLAISLALFILIVAITAGKSARAPNKGGELLQALTSAHFEESIFPTAIFDCNLSIVLMNRSFRETFIESILQEPASIADVTRLWQTAEGKALLTHLLKSSNLPQNPLLIHIDFANDRDEKESYITVFRYFESSSKAPPFFSFTAVDSKYTASIADDLVARIAEKDSNLKKLEEVDRLKSEFLATLSHELKTPLVSIKGYLDLIASEKMGPLTEKQAKALQVTLKNASHLNSMISSMLNFARMEAGKLMFDLVHQKLPQRIAETIDSMRPIADNRNITIQPVLEKDLPAVIVDPELIHRVMCNLIENSIKFSATGSVVTVEASRFSPQLVKIQVVDKGCGIPADKLELIKTPFYQIVKSDTRPSSGLGLGLAICEKILVGHGTSLHIESREGHGTTCSFSLRVVDSQN